MFFNNFRKYDQDLYNHDSSRFIPIAYHYDKNIIITKNGEMFQTIEIQGISAYHTSEVLPKLRSDLRKAIAKYMTKNMALWIHTVRSRANLDSGSYHDDPFASNVHEVWIKQNEWDRKFVNIIYITIVHDSSALGVKNFTAFINSLKTNVIKSFHNQYFDYEASHLNKTVDNIISYLGQYNPVKLGISKTNDGRSISTVLSFYYQIIHMHKKDIYIDTVDLSKQIALQKYAIGHDALEISDDKNIKFMKILSLHEYHEIDVNTLEGLMQLPIEFVITEVLFLARPKLVKKAFKHNKYILEVSRDPDLFQDTGLDAIMASDNAGLDKFCMQSISMSVIHDSLDGVAQNLNKLSNALSKLGVAHIKEDMKLEKVFWAQLPGNFSFLANLVPTILRNSCAFASIQATPLGVKTKEWGEYITIFPTYYNTPYFMYLYDKNHKGVNCVFGVEGSGRTTFSNFLISESTKISPTILYFTDNDCAEIFINAISGQWIELKNKMINPFIIHKTEDSMKFLYEFMKILCNHCYQPLNDKELKTLNGFVDVIFTIDIKERSLSKILETLNFSGDSGQIIEKRLSVFKSGGRYEGLFDGLENINIKANQIIGVNLYNFTEKHFNKTNPYPLDTDLQDKFITDRNINNSMRQAIIYALSYNFNHIQKDDNPILVFDNMNKIFNLNHFYQMFEEQVKYTEKVSGVLLCNYDPCDLSKLNNQTAIKFMKIINTKIILPQDMQVANLDKMLQLSKQEFQSISAFALNSRTFLLKVDDVSLLMKFNISGLGWVKHVLSPKPAELEIYRNIIKENPKLRKDDLVDKFYKILM
ncbi:MAG: hypothetical protein AB8B67_02030 [Rickettsiaceae bacterium]